MAAKDFVFVFDDFLPRWLYEKAVDEICSDRFPWFYPAVGIVPEPDPTLTCFGSNLIRSTGEDFTAVAPVVNYIWRYFKDTYKHQWDNAKIIRLRANMYAPGQTTRRHHDNAGENAWALLYYLTASDGGTEIEGERYQHEPNRAIVFPADMMHQAIPATSPARVTLNWNFFADFDWDAHRSQLAADK